MLCLKNVFHPKLFKIPLFHSGLRLVSHLLLNSDNWHLWHLIAWTFTFLPTSLLYSGNSDDGILHFLIIAIAVFSIFIIGTKKRKLSPLYLFLFNKFIMCWHCAIPCTVWNTERIKAQFFPTKRQLELCGTYSKR